MKHSIEIDELNKFLSIGDTLTLLDVRRKTDYEATPQKIVGAVWRDPEKIDIWVTQLPVCNRTVVYCVKGGSVSQSVAERMRREGLDALFLEGGLKAWIDSDQAVEDIYVLPGS